MGVVRDRFPRMEHVEVPALDRGLGLDLAAAGPRRRLDRAAVLDHLEGATGPLELGHDLVSDPAAVLGRLERACLVGVLRRRLARRDEVVRDLVRTELATADRVDAGADLAKRRLDSTGEVVDLP